MLCYRDLWQRYHFILSVCFGSCYRSIWSVCMNRSCYGCRGTVSIQKDLWRGGWTTSPQ